MDMWLEALALRLTATASVAEVGAVICGHANEYLGMAHSSLVVFDPDQRIRIHVDDFGDVVSDQARIRYVTESPIDPHLKSIIESHAPHGDDSTDDEVIAWAQAWGDATRSPKIRTLPLLEPRGLLGFLRSVTFDSLTPMIQRDLGVLATYASTRLVQLGITAHGGTVPHLTRRQREVASYACRGYTNREIAGFVGASVNTVKKHLQTAFERLGVDNRTALAAQLARTGPTDDAPPGVTRFADVWVTKRA